MALTSVIVKSCVLIGQLIFTSIYGTMGSILAVLQLIRVGPTKFFGRIERSTLPSQATDPVYGKHDMIKLKSSGVTLHYVSKGTIDQPLMLFVHGFPECWYSWKNQIKYFSKNYRVVAIDQRGYGLSSKPPNVSDYKVELLARDIADVVDQLGYTSCILVGHDWGAVVSWTVAMLYPQLVNKLIILNVPHPAAFIKNMSLKQVRRSWYIFFYQIPYIPELVFQSNDFEIYQNIFYRKPMGLTNRNNMTWDDIEVYKYTFSQKGTVTAAINYYRAAARNQKDKLKARITVPVLIVWGCQDQALGEELADGSVKYCDNVQLKKIRNASHWVQLDAPDEVNQYIEAFLNEKSTR